MNCEDDFPLQIFWCLITILFYSKFINYKDYNSYYLLGVITLKIEYF